MKSPWLIVLALLVVGLATLFATTMTHLARLNPDAQTLVVTRPAAPAASPTMPAAPAPGPTEPAKAEAPRGAEAGADRTAPDGAAVPLPQPVAREPEAGVAGTAAGGAAATPANPPRPLAVPPVQLSAPGVRRADAIPGGPGAAAAPRETRSSAPTSLAGPATDPRTARCRALADYLRDLDAESARGPDLGRQTWLVEQRNIVRDRQSELGC